MEAMEDDQPLVAFMTTVTMGDTITGTVAEVTRSGAVVLLDGFADYPIGFIGSLDLSWSFDRRRNELLQVGDRVTAEVITVDLRRRQVLLSRAATEHPQLWAYLKALRPGQRLSGTVAAIERFGVFVDLDDGPKHPVFPGVGFITIPELSWRWSQDPSEIISIGERITCEVLAFDTSNGEARLSLRATQPDPLQQFAREVQVGQILRGKVTKLTPVGAFARVADGIEGLIRLHDVSTTQTPEQAIQVGEEVTVVVTEIDLPRRRVTLSQYPGSPGPGPV